MIYVHIPFCERKCNYCALNSKVDGRRLMSASKIDDVRDKIFSRLKSAESVSFEREEIFR